MLDLNDSKVIELHEMPQDVSAYIKNHQDATTLKEAQLGYKERFYGVWQKVPRISKEKAMWAHRVFTEEKKLYGVNLKRLDRSFFMKMEQNADFDAYMSVNKKALTIHATNIRAFPTDERLFKNPALAGEGFPFDYLQNSFIAANKPIFISHFSKDRRWVFAFSSFASGWIKTQDIVFINKNDAAFWQEAKQVFVLIDGKPIYDEKGEFLFTLRLGMYLPLIDEDEQSYTLLAASRENLKTPRYIKFKLSKHNASVAPLLFTKENIEKILLQLQKSRYGWGGMFALRDCSSTMRDYFAPFGIWLGRNSSVQAKAGRVISLEGLSDDKKRSLIKKEGVPFETLLYKKRHIMLYLGIYNGKIAVFQNLWGIKTKFGEQSGRVVIGHALYSTLNLGKNLPGFDKDASLIKKLKSMNIVTIF